MEPDAPKAQVSKGPTLEWMYKPAALVDREEYLTGRTVDKSLKLLDELEKGNNPTEFNYLAEAEKDLTPLSIFVSQGSGPIDIIKKIKDDPLYQIQKKEQESLKKLLQNPVKMKELNKLVDARDSAKSSHSHKKHKRKHSKHKKHKKDDGASSSSSRRRHKSTSSSSSSDDRDRRKRRDRDEIKDPSRQKEKGSTSARSRRRKSDRSGSDSDADHEARRRKIIESFKRKVQERSGNGGSSRDKDDGHSRPRDIRPPAGRPAARPKLDEEELEKRRKEMMENAKWREQQRTKNVTKYREDEKKEEESLKSSRDPDFIRKQLLEAASTGSVEQRVKSNSYNIQRSKSSMDQNFVRR